ncbi:DUF1002 domain-containing protein [Peribacillus psychrosaccharolyticus]|uniref:DUF1002 domain-containing protein n=1 Tax=Peribacillus psychrosaccharolyticus TaxID=1407 RepID=UPI003D27AA0F
MKQSMIKKYCVIALMLCLFFPIRAFADAAVGDQVVTLGENLTTEQKNMLLAEMKAPADVEILTVTNQEEHEYLGKYIAKRLIGTKAISSSSITLEKAGTGLTVETKNINWVSEEMFINALATAGVKDAAIYATAPIPVSGTAALTGIIKAYELSSDTAIPEDVKQAANEEMVKTAELGDEVGAEKAAALMTRIKEQMAENPPKTDDDIRTIIETSSKEIGLNLTEDQIQSLLDLFKKLKDLNIDWNQVGDQLDKAKEKLTTFLESEEGQGFLDKLKGFFSSIIDAIKALFS